MAYLSYNLAALCSELIAPKYFLAIPLTIITYKEWINKLGQYLPLFAVSRNTTKFRSPL